MKRIQFILSALAIASLVFVSCSDDNNNDEQEKFRKLDQILTGENLATATLSTDFTWVGEQLRQVDEYEDGQVEEQTKILYTDATGTRIQEIQMYSPYVDKKSLAAKIFKALNAMRPEGQKEMVQYMRMVPTYQNNKVTRLDIYGNLSNKNDLPHSAYVAITYTGDNPTMFSMRVLNPMPGVSEIEFMRMYFVWNNGNIVTDYSKMLDIEGSGQFVTNDSTVYTYDNKVNAFSSMRINPMVEAQTNSRNNILTARYYYPNGETGVMELSGEQTSTYVYDSENYPASSTETETWWNNNPYTWVRKFEYKNE